MQYLERRKVVWRDGALSWWLERRDGVKRRGGPMGKRKEGGDTESEAKMRRCGVIVERILTKMR